MRWMDVRVSPKLPPHVEERGVVETCWDRKADQCPQTTAVEAEPQHPKEDDSGHAMYCQAVEINQRPRHYSYRSEAMHLGDIMFAAALSPKTCSIDGH
jgi:hypothetical protein